MNPDGTSFSGSWEATRGLRAGEGQGLTESISDSLKGLLHKAEWAKLHQEKYTEAEEIRERYCQERLKSFI